MRTISYHTLAAGGATDRCVKKEVVLMGHANRTPANRRLLAALSTMLVVVFVVVLVAIVMGPGRAIGWIVTYLIPVVMILGVVIAVLALLVWALKKLPTPPYRDWWQ
jgi:protein-S-isoprenylcysteine O-methyltransferase Ste14